MATFVPSTRMEHGKVKWSGHYHGIPHTVLNHPSFAALSGGSVKLLLCLAAAHFGNNNGHLTATLSRLKGYGFNSKESIAKGLRQLVDYGYIVRARANVIREPALYAITWFPINPSPPGQKYDAGVVPGNEALDLWRTPPMCNLAAAA